MEILQITWIRININFVGNDIFPCDWSQWSQQLHVRILSLIFKLKVRISSLFLSHSSSHYTYLFLVNRCWLWIFISSISINTDSQSHQIRFTLGCDWKLFQVLVLISISAHDQRYWSDIQYSHWRYNQVTGLQTAECTAIFLKKGWFAWLLCLLAPYTSLWFW